MVNLILYLPAVIIHGEKKIKEKAICRAMRIEPVTFDKRTKMLSHSPTEIFKVILLNKRMLDLSALYRRLLNVIYYLQTIYFCRIFYFIHCRGNTKERKYSERTYACINCH